ncbi:MAG: DUF5985 family protein [Polyangiaceae bacterium]
MNQIFCGALSMASWVAGMFFLRFWRSTRDRFFFFFVAGFWGLALDWLWLAERVPTPQSQHYAYIPRLVAFIMIILGIVDKNRRG